MIVGHISKSRNCKTWKVVLFSHAVQVRASAVCRFDRRECTEETLTRTLEYMTCEKRLKEYLLLSLIDIEPTGYNIGLQTWERLLPKAIIYFYFHMEKKKKSLFWNKEDLHQILGEISNSKDIEAEEKNWWWYYGLSNIGSIEKPVRSNICSASPILQRQEMDWLFCAVLFWACFSESLRSVYYRDLQVILWINIRSVLVSH